MKRWEMFNKWFHEHKTVEEQVEEMMTVREDDPEFMHADPEETKKDMITWMMEEV